MTNKLVWPEWPTR